MGSGVVGLISSYVERNGDLFPSSLFMSNDIIESGLKTGLMIAIVFPIFMLMGVSTLKKKDKTKRAEIVKNSD